MSIPSAMAAGGGWRALANLADDYDLTFTERLVLYELAARINPETGIWSPVACTDWARLLGTTYRTLRAALRGIEDRGWITTWFPRGHEGSVKATDVFKPYLFCLVTTANTQLPRATVIAPTQMRHVHTSAQTRIPPAAEHITALALMPPGPNSSKEGSSHKDSLPSFANQVAAHLGEPLSSRLMSPSNTGARRKIDNYLKAASDALGNPERVLAKVLEQWPPPGQIHNPAGFLLERARSTMEWAATPAARAPEPTIGDVGVPSPTAYATGLASEVLAGRQDAESARYNCDFAFSTEVERSEALAAFDTVLASVESLAVDVRSFG